jgi:hypothetical protein
VASWVPPRLRQIVGLDLDDVTSERFDSLIGLPEDTDLEFKAEPWPRTEGGSKECALDVADKANAGGALIIVGIAEDDEGKAVALTPLAVAEEDLGLRVHQIIAERISPPPVVTHRQIAVDGGTVHVFSIAPSVRGPHGVAVGGHALRYPVRSGVTRRYLSEPEISDRYQRRFLAAVDRGTQLEVAHGKAEALVPSDKGEEPWSWLVLSAVPEAPGDLALRPGLAGEWSTWIKEVMNEFPTYDRAVTIYVAPAFRALSVSDDYRVVGADLYSVGGHLTLDGIGSWVFGYPGGPDAMGAVPNTSMVWDEHLVGDLINAIGILARHALKTTATGAVTVQAELLSSKPMLVGQYRRSIMPGQLSGSRQVDGSTGLSRHTSLLDDLAVGGVARVALARLLALDLLSAFGLAQVQQITDDGAFALDRFQQPWQQSVRDWAASYDVPVIASLPE